MKDEQRIQTIEMMKKKKGFVIAELNNGFCRTISYSIFEKWDMAFWIIYKLIKHFRRIKIVSRHGIAIERGKLAGCIEGLTLPN